MKNPMRVESEATKTKLNDNQKALGELPRAFFFFRVPPLVRKKEEALR